MDKETAKKEIQALVEKFDKEKKSKELSTYSEQDRKNAFINPLFEALGWNISDRSEIASEQNIKGAGRPDYAFKINGITQFFLEAKKVSADLDAEEWAPQVINYSWNKVVTYAVLTNFESLKVFNAQRIDKTDLMDKLVFELP